MGEKVNTGKYRICRDITGQGGTKETISEFDDLEECKSAFQLIDKVDKYNYYIEEEAYFKGTLKDSSGKPIDSTKGWTRMA
ncbi:hypothetical protein [Nonlabens sp. Asnod3-H03]|uniref:hypothetical protein n=1 Tax=Nonlabens sp. Asnod3-H03 TaxID=3160580 RepID=UPI0038633BA6